MQQSGTLMHTHKLRGKVSAKFFRWEMNLNKYANKAKDKNTRRLPYNKKMVEMKDKKTTLYVHLLYYIFHCTNYTYVQQVKMLAFLCFHVYLVCIPFQAHLYIKWILQKIFPLYLLLFNPQHSQTAQFSALKAPSYQFHPQACHTISFLIHDHFLNHQIDVCPAEHAWDLGDHSFLVMIKIWAKLHLENRSQRVFVTVAGVHLKYSKRPSPVV